MTTDQIESLAIRAALGNNGGAWATHYNETQKDFWRTYVRDLAAVVVAAERERHATRLEGVRIGLSIATKCVNEIDGKQS
jgi:hypothetical protein